MLRIGGALPALAVLVLVMSVYGEGRRTAIIALTVITLLPIARRHLREPRRGAGSAEGGRTV